MTPEEVKTAIEALKNPSSHWPHWTDVVTSILLHLVEHQQDKADMAVKLKQAHAQIDHWCDRALKAEAALASHAMRHQAENNYAPAWD